MKPVQAGLFAIDELNENQQDVFMTREDGTIKDDNGKEKQICELSSDSDGEKTRGNHDDSVSKDFNELRGIKKLISSKDLYFEDKKCCIVNIDCENEAAIAGYKSLNIGKPSISEVVIVSSSDSGSNASDANKNARDM